MKDFEIKVNDYGITLDLMTLVLFLTVFVLLFLLYRAQKSQDNFDIRDLVIDKETERLSLSKFGQFTALLVSTWGFVTLTLNNGLTEWYYTSYMAIWAIAEGFRKWGKIQIGRNSPAEDKKAESLDQDSSKSR